MNIVLAPLIFGFHLSEVFILAQNRSSSLHSKSYPYKLQCTQSKITTYIFLSWNLPNTENPMRL